MQAAIDLAIAGYPVFPCLASKAPATPHGFKDATDDPEQVARLWREYPGPLIGVPTGEVSGFDVLDLDPKNGCARWWDIHAAQVPETRIHQTQSGGWHLLFHHHPEVRNSQSKIGAGVDTRGEGGFIIWWPACGGKIVSDADMAFWPEWLIEALTYQKPPPVFVAPKTVKARTRLVSAMIERALVRVETAPDGDKHHQLRAAARTIGGLLDVSGVGAGEVRAALLAAVQRAGAKDMIGAEKTVAYALEQGARIPWQLGTQNDG